jgi:hypothetical protein
LSRSRELQPQPQRRRRRRHQHTPPSSTPLRRPTRAGRSKRIPWTPL